jgi:hypothetical protein
MRLLVLMIRWTGGSPASIQIVCRCPCINGWSSAQLRHGGPIDYVSTGLGDEPNGSCWSRHLLTGSAIRPAANPKNALNPQDSNVFPQVQSER